MTQAGLHPFRRWGSVSLTCNILTLAPTLAAGSLETPCLCYRGTVESCIGVPAGLVQSIFGTPSDSHQLTYSLTGLWIARSLKLFVQGLEAVISQASLEGFLFCFIIVHCLFCFVFPAPTAVRLQAAAESGSPASHSHLSLCWPKHLCVHSYALTWE